MRKINVLYLTKYMELAGAETVVANLATSLDKERYNVTVCTFEMGPLVEVIRKRGVEVVVLERKIRYDISLLLNLIRLIRQKKIDIVHSHTFQTHFYGFPAAKLSGTPIFIMNEHGNYEYKLIKKRRFYLNKFFMYFSDAILAVSNALKEDLIKYLGAPPEKITVIYNGVDTTRFHGPFDIVKVKRSLNLDLDDFIVGNVSNLNPVKGHVYFLKAVANVLKEVPNTKFLLIGDGLLRAELESQCEDLGISKNVIFLGRRQDIADILSIMDILTISSLYETFCIAIAEAMAMAKPVVATKVGGIPELVEDGITGILTPPKDPDQMASSIIKLLKDKELAERMGKAGLERIKNNFSLNVIISEIDRFYQKLIREKIKSRQK